MVYQKRTIKECTGTLLLSYKNKPPIIMNGELISIEEAHGYIERHKTIYDELSGIQVPTQYSRLYVTSKFNAFIFDREIIESLLHQTDDNGCMPSHFMVHFAAEKDGVPTIVILGCKESSDGTGIKYSHMNAPKPAGETPGKRVIHSIPKGLYPQIVFTIE